MYLKPTPLGWHGLPKLGILTAKEKFHQLKYVIEMFIWTIYMKVVSNNDGWKCVNNN